MEAPRPDREALQQFPQHRQQESLRADRELVLRHRVQNVDVVDSLALVHVALMQRVHPHIAGVWPLLFPYRCPGRPRRRFRAHPQPVRPAAPQGVQLPVRDADQKIEAGVPELRGASPPIGRSGSLSAEHREQQSLMAFAASMLR